MSGKHARDLRQIAKTAARRGEPQRRDLSFLSGDVKQVIQDAPAYTMTSKSGVLTSPESEMDTRALREQQEMKCRVLIYGHTHEPFVDNSLTLANTGS